ncbi:RHS repeat protein [Micromonospora sp. DR5-3]|uniref:RHS repeat-associated core domain-containing protein n=1 Tax=Micromonospora sp. DR5-3 TaxID=2992129 RepID=UPI002230D5DF|nr:RHS repeat-associated core domain-containing protein [Micromonospora sp. DR5-3]MCW3819641.1 RHS repeat protein [Micromonospora sp. DR5-3]
MRKLLFSTGVRRRMAVAMPVVLAASLVDVLVAPGRALAAGPSVPLPETPSVSVSQQTMVSRPPDQASASALQGDQPAGSDAALDGGGTYSATPLSPSATWEVSAQTGDFTWSYPLRVPPSPGGLEPELSLSYASSQVDGRTSATNNQPSWVGDGWDLSAGFIERTYSACMADTMGGTTPPKVGDLCWRSDNAAASYRGQGGMLIKDDATGGWRAKRDDGSRIERLTGVANGDDNGEYWKITTVDGTEYFFGSRPGSGSTWTVPVFGDDADEPCHGTTFDTSHCTQAWRWNLDKVVDRHGNMIIYSYDTETNSYGFNLKDAAVSYIRGGTLKTVEYGLREGSSAAATGRVVFTPADRCVAGSTCTFDRKENWPDTPLDQRCDSATCADRHSPTFWSTKRLAKITTQVRNGADYDEVDSWTLDHQFPDPGDGEKAALWLRGITHTGLVNHPGTAGGAVALPSVTFEGTKMPNRVFKVDGVAPLIRYRITGVVSESGGVLSVYYADPDCVEGSSMPANPESNTLRCFPVRWSKKDYAERTDYFHKYVVAQVAQSDRISSNPEQVTSYEYLDGAAWHFDTSEVTEDDKKTWNEFRGFKRVRIRAGKQGDPSGPITMTEQRFYRGMNGDKQPAGTRSVSVTDSENGRRTDDDWLQGFPLETITYNGDNGPMVSKEISTPTVQGPTATRGAYQAYVVRTGATQSYTALAAGGRRTTRTEWSYDDRGLVTRTNDLGDTSTADDDRCTRVTYLRNTGRWLLNLPARSETVAVSCDKTPSFPADAIADTRTAYDGQGFDAAPTTGDATRVEEADERPASGPVYVMTATAKYDSHGRVTESGDALGRVTKTSYTPALDGPATQTVSTNPLGHTVTTTLDPAWGQPTIVVDANGRKTEIAYDALGRTAEVWLANRPRTPSVRGNSRFTYLIRNDAPSVVTTTKITANGTYTSTKQLYDGLLRLRQTQTPAIGGGRLLTDTRYDSQGRVYKATKPYFNEGGLDDTLWVAADVDVPGLTFTEFDGAGRKTAEIFKGGGAEKWRTTTTYGGDRVNMTPPQGGTATTTITDARGQTTELRQYHAGMPSGAYDATTYKYNDAGKLTSVTDPAGNTWRYTYDLRGRQTRTEDVDKGASTMTYDAAGQLTTATDARAVTLAYQYDALGRRTATRQSSLTGPMLAEWTFDTAMAGKGLPASATAYVDGKPYTRNVLRYTPLNQPSESSITIPDSEHAQKLLGTYTTTLKYKVDGSLSSKSFQAVGGLFEETVTYEYEPDLGHLWKSRGGPTGSTIEYVTDTGHTRYGEVARLQLGDVGKRAWQSYYYDDHTRRLARTIVDAEVTQPMQADLRYSYDPAGNVTSIADTPQGQPADTQCFRYDHLRRMTEAWTPGTDCGTNPSASALAGPAPYWQSFTFDVIGNRRTDTQHAAAGDTVRTYTYPAPGAGQAHALQSVTTTGPSGTNQDGYDYDAAGNTTIRPGQQLHWDLRGHLAKVTEAGGDTEYLYDADGNRLIRSDPTGRTLYLDGQELRMDAATGQLTGTRYYEHGGKTVAMRDPSGLTWLGSDNQGTAQFAINSTTQKVIHRRQTPFGVPRGSAVAFPGEKGFVGGTIDSSTGLTHLGAREYDADTGRFISVDPIMDVGDPQQMNAYAYSNNSPATFSDPDGLKFCSDSACGPGADYVDRSGNFHEVRGHNDGCGGCSGAYDPWKYAPSRTYPRGSYPKRAATTISAPARSYVPCNSGYAAGCRVTEKRYQEWRRSELERQRKAQEQARQINDALASMLDTLLSASYSVCVGAYAAGMAMAASEWCLSFDKIGIAWNTGTKAGIAYGAGAGITFGVKIDSGSADNVNGGNSFFTDYGPEAGKVLGGKAQVGAEIPFDGQPPTSSFNIGGGFEIGGNIGSAGVNTGHNPGYKLRWDDPLLRQAMLDSQRFTT